MKNDINAYFNKLVVSMRRTYLKKLKTLEKRMYFALVKKIYDCPLATPEEIIKSLESDFELSSRYYMRDDGSRKKCESTVQIQFADMWQINALNGFGKRYLRNECVKKSLQNDKAIQRYCKLYNERNEELKSLLKTPPISRYGNIIQYPPEFLDEIVKIYSQIRSIERILINRSGDINFYVEKHMIDECALKTRVLTSK